MLDTAQNLLLNGVGGGEFAMAAVRVATGGFFVFSGYHKLFNRERHAELVKTLKGDGVPLVAVNQWFVPSVEFFGGLGVVFGVLTPLAALGLFIICAVACAVDGLERIAAMKPIDWADYLDDVLYLPEVLYLGLLLYFVTHGGGMYSLDALAATLI